MAVADRQEDVFGAVGVTDRGSSVRAVRRDIPELDIVSFVLARSDTAICASIRTRARLRRPSDVQVAFFRHGRPLGVVEASFGNRLPDNVEIIGEGSSEGIEITGEGGVASRRGTEHVVRVELRALPNGWRPTEGGAVTYAAATFRSGAYYRLPRPLPNLVLDYVPNCLQRRTLDGRIVGRRRCNPRLPRDRPARPR